MMAAARLTQISFYAGLATIAVLIAANGLLQAFPPAPGHKSATFSEIGGLLFLLSAACAVLAIVGLVAGIKALRRFDAETPIKQKVAAWVGVTVCAAYTSLMLLPFFI